MQFGIQCYHLKKKKGKEKKKRQVKLFPPLIQFYITNVKAKCPAHKFTAILSIIKSTGWEEVVFYHVNCHRC